MNRRGRRGARVGTDHAGPAAGWVRRRLPRGDRGSAVIEVVLVTPLIIVLLLIAAGLGRMAHARAQVVGAARDAARAASLERAPGRAQAAGEQAARRSLGQAGVSCTAMTVSVDVSEDRPGGQVTARVSCTTSMAGLGLAGFSPTKTVTDVAVVPIEIFRGADG